MSRRSAPGRTSSPPRVVFLINNAAFFVSHRLPLALGARDAGWDVRLVVGQAADEEQERHAEAVLAERRIPVTRVGFQSAGTNPVEEARGCLQLVLAMQRLRPDIIHTASPKAGLYGGIAARLARVPGLVVAVSGLGFLYADHATLSGKLIGGLYRRLMPWAYSHPNRRIIVQNEEDRAALIGGGVASADELVSVRGSGVSLESYLAIRPEAAERLLVLPARMLREKGVHEFVEAAAIVRAARPEWRFALAGTSDARNPSAVPPSELSRWSSDGVVEWLGHVREMESVYARAAIVCLPSYYREGVPKALLEAAAAGRAVVTTDWIGCRDAVIPGETGDLVPIRDAPALARTLLALIDDADRRRRYGTAGRALATSTFDVRLIVERTLAVYREILIAAGGSPPG